MQLAEATRYGMGGAALLFAFSQRRGRERETERNEEREIVTEVGKRSCT